MKTMEQGDVTMRDGRPALEEVIREGGVLELRPG